MYNTSAYLCQYMNIWTGERDRDCDVLGQLRKFNQNKNKDVNLEF